MFESNSQAALRVLALIDDQFARIRYDVWPIPMNPEELADKIDALIKSDEPARDYGRRLSDERARVLHQIAEARSDRKAGESDE